MSIGPLLVLLGHGSVAVEIQLTASNVGDGDDFVVKQFPFPPPKLPQSNKKAPFKASRLSRVDVVHLSS